MINGYAASEPKDANAQTLSRMIRVNQNPMR